MESRQNNIDQVILEESKSLGELIALIKAKTSFGDWPERLQQAFLAAFFPGEDAISQVERLKAIEGRRTIGLSEIIITSGSRNTRLAERVRADLPGCIGFKSCRYLARELFLSKLASHAW